VTELKQESEKEKGTYARSQAPVAMRRGGSDGARDAETMAEEDLISRKEGRISAGKTRGDGHAPVEVGWIPAEMRRRWLSHIELCGWALPRQGADEGLTRQALDTQGLLGQQMLGPNRHSHHLTMSGLGLEFGSGVF
jgi:hypothetical protein